MARNYKVRLTITKDYDVLASSDMEARIKAMETYEPSMMHSPELSDFDVLYYEDTLPPHQIKIT